MVATTHMWLLSIWNMASVTKKMIKLILINLNIILNSQWLVATVLESTVLYSFKGQMG